MYNPKLEKCVEGSDLKRVDGPGAEDSLNGEDTNKDIAKDDEILELAKDFAARVQKLELGPAEIMSICWPTSNHLGKLLRMWMH